MPFAGALFGATAEVDPHVPLTPLHFLDRSATVYPNRAALIHGVLRQTWAQTRDRCHRLASALAGRDIPRGNTVAIVAPNAPAMLEAHFGVPLAGAVLDAINIRLDAASARSFMPDVALLDIGLPGMDGCALARELRALAGDKIYLIAMTGAGRIRIVKRRATPASIPT